jgi:hypothetical protein
MRYYLFYLLPNGVADVKELPVLHQQKFKLCCQVLQDVARICSPVGHLSWKIEEILILLGTLGHYHSQDSSAYPRNKLMKDLSSSNYELDELII